MRPRLAGALRALSLKPEDASFLVSAGAAAALLHAGAMLSWSALMGRYVSALGAEAMPVMYVAVNLVCGGLFLAMAARGRRGRGGPRRIAALAAAGGVALSLLPGSRNPSVAFAGFLASWLYLVVFELEFWTWLANLLPLRLAKRLTPAVGGIGTAGRIVGALLATDPFGWRSIPSLLRLAALAAVLAVPLLGAAGQAAAAHPEVDQGGEDAPESPPPRLLESVRRVADSGLLRRVLMLAFVAGFFKGAADYPLAVTANLRFDREQDLAAFFGALGGVVNLAAVILQLLGTGPLLRRQPLRRTVGIFPGGVGIASLGAALFPGFYPALAVRFLQRLGNRALYTPMAVTLVNPVPAGSGLAVRALTLGVGAAAGTLCAGLVLSMVPPGPEPLWMVHGILALVGLIGALSALGSDQAYLQGLLSCSGESPEAAAALAARAAARPENRPFVAALLASPDPDHRELVVRAVRDPDGPLDDCLYRLLDEIPLDTALGALALMEEQDATGQLTAKLLIRVLRSHRPAAVVRAARSAGVLGGSATRSCLRGLLAEELLGPYRTVRPWLAGALLRLATDERSLRAAVRELRTGTVSSDPEVRAATLSALGALGLPVFLGAMCAGLEDPEDEVAIAAARALGAARLPGCLPMLRAARERVDASTPRGAALRRASTRIQNRALDEVAGLLERMGDGPRRRLARAAAGLRGGRRLELLDPALRLEPAETRVAVVRALRDLSDRELLEALGSALRRRELGTRPLLDYLAAGGEEAEEVAFDLVSALHRPSDQAEVRSTLSRLLGDLDPGEMDLGRLRRRLEVAAFLAGLGSGSASSMRTAVGQVGEGDGRGASAALELLETGLPSAELRGRMVESLEQYRRRVQGQ